MGCGSSTIGVAGANDQTEKTQPKHAGELQKSNRGTENGISPHKGTKKDTPKPKTVDSNGNTVKMDQTPVPKAIAFDVSLDGQNTELFLAKRTPKRLQILEPLDLPKLSAEQLAEKQRLAEEKREKVRQKRASASKKASRRRQELMRAKEFEMQNQLQQEKALDEQQKQADLKREARLKEIQEKQRIREERAKRAREKAKRINQGDGDDIDVEKDDNFNASDVDSWLGDDGTERAEPEYSDPTKRVQSALRKPTSASTVDSYDAAFQRQGQTTNSQLERDLQEPHDVDFFGS